MLDAPNLDIQPVPESGGAGKRDGFRDSRRDPAFSGELRLRGLRAKAKLYSWAGTYLAK
jgi:hypothetical protein